MNKVQLEEICVTIIKDSSCMEKVCLQITAAMARLNKSWDSRNVSFLNSDFTSLLLCCMAVRWGPCLRNQSGRSKCQVFEMKCSRRLLRISYREQKMNDFIRSLVTCLTGPQEPLLPIVKRQKLVWFSHAIQKDTLPKSPLGLC